MKDRHLNIFYSEENGGHIADIPDLPHMRSTAGAGSMHCSVQIRRRKLSPDSRASIGLFVKALTS